MVATTKAIIIVVV